MNTYSTSANSDKSIYKWYRNHQLKTVWWTKENNIRRCQHIVDICEAGCHDNCNLSIFEKVVEKRNA